MSSQLYNLGRIRSPHDARDVPLRKLLTLQDWFNGLWRRKIVWTMTGVTNQGQTNGCTGFSIANLGYLTPKLSPVLANNGMSIYQLACKFDGNEGRDEGATTRSSLKAAQKLGFLKNYAFAYTLDEMEMYVRSRGPLIFASDWYEGMDNPKSSNGFFIEPIGRNRGGHQYVIHGVDARNRDKRIWFIESSWSETYGDRGTARMTDPAVHYLLASNGECAAPVEWKTRPQ